MNGKRLFAITVIEKINDFSHFFIGINLQVLPEDLSEGHLPHSYHASPPSISDIGSLDIMVQFRKACAVG